MSTQGEAPEWTPLLRAVGEKVTGWFMWMFEVRLDDGTRLHAYKHRITRRYVHLSDTGGAFLYCGEQQYLPINVVEGVAAAVLGWDPDNRLLANWQALVTLAEAELEKLNNVAP